MNARTSQGIRVACLLLQVFASCACFWPCALPAQTQRPDSVTTGAELGRLGSGQGAPNVTFSQLLEAAAASYPTLVAARTEVRAAAQDIQAAERQRWPSFSATVESDSGNLRSPPTQAVQAELTLWDAGRNAARISDAQVAADISQLKVNLQQQEVFLQMATAWQSMISARERLVVAEQTLLRLKNYQAQMRRRVQADASPVIDLELVDARLLQTDVERTTAQSSLQVALRRLQQFSGIEGLSANPGALIYLCAAQETAGFEDFLAQANWEQLAAAHPQVAKARLEVTQVQHRLASKKAEAFPQVFARIYKPLNALPTSSDTSLTAFMGLRYTPGAGFATLVEAQAMSTRLLSAEQGVEASYRETLQTLQNDREEFSNARSRLASLEQSVKGADKVLESYQRQFQAGRKSWLDLLNAVRELAQNQYASAEAKATLAAAMIRLQIRLGQDPQ
jgi:outer membrane protein, adhesin transport system